MLIFLGSKDQTVRVWDLSSGNDCGIRVHSRLRVNTKFVLRGLLFALVVLGLIIAALAVVLSGFLAGPPAGPAPPPASLSAPRGEMPSAPVGMGEWAK